MATTTLIPVHVGTKGTAKNTLARIIRYVKNPEKTENGNLVSGYGCNPGIADAEFVYMKRRYIERTGRYQGKSDVIAYQLRQSFVPGEITAEEANRLGQELAQRFTHGTNAFIVATHTDTKHVHNHIIISAVSLDYSRKFRNFWGSSKALRRLSDIICIENGYSIVENPKRKGKNYGEWLGENRPPTQRDGLRSAIETALTQHPNDLETLLALLQKEGWEIKRGKHIALRGPGQYRFKRLDSLGNGFTQAELTEKLKQQAPSARDKANHGKPDKRKPSVNLIVDIQEKLKQGKGPGYEQWAKKYNLKEMARTLSFLREHDLLNMEKLDAVTASAREKNDSNLKRIQEIEARMKEISQLKTHIIQYSKTREVYAQYKKSNWSPKFAVQHEQEIAIHRAAKKAFDALGVKKIPKVSELSAEYAALQKEKDALYPEYKKSRDELRELLIARENVRRYLELDGQQTVRTDKNRRKIQS